MPYAVPTVPTRSYLDTAGGNAAGGRKSWGFPALFPPFPPLSLERERKSKRGVGHTTAKSSRTLGGNGAIISTQSLGFLPFFARSHLAILETLKVGTDSFPVRRWTSAEGRSLPGPKHRAAGHLPAQPNFAPRETGNEPIPGYEDFGDD